MQESGTVWCKERLPQQLRNTVNRFVLFFQAFLGSDGVGEGDFACETLSPCPQFTFLSFLGQRKERKYSVR